VWPCVAGVNEFKKRTDLKYVTPSSATALAAEQDQAASVSNQIYISILVYLNIYEFFRWGYRKQANLEKFLLKIMVIMCL